ncbi:MAG: hypothetical protein ABR981_02685 [Candidatus Micrarchaeaceae archaeon]|jgi:hypothetical protein
MITMKLGILDIFKGGKSQTLTITSINLKLHGQMHTMEGLVSKEKSFEVDIPFKNKTHTDLLTEATSFKSEKAKPITIKSIEASEPFKIVSITPQPPLEVKADERIDFKIKLEGPEHNYTGPLTISFGSNNVETIHVEITKTILNVNGVKTAIETSSRILNLQKGQIFNEKIQLYKALSYGDSVKSIEIEKPFAFVSSDPKLPVKIDDSNSYLLNIYIQGPEAPYAGAMEIKLS